MTNPGIRATRRERNLLQAKAAKRKKEMLEAERREHEEHAIWQARLKQETATRHPEWFRGAA